MALSKSPVQNSTPFTGKTYFAELHTKTSRNRSQNERDISWRTCSTPFSVGCSYATKGNESRWQRKARTVCEKRAATSLPETFICLLQKFLVVEIRLFRQGKSKSITTTRQVPHNHQWFKARTHSTFLQISSAFFISFCNQVCERDHTLFKWALNFSSCNPSSTSMS